MTETRFGLTLTADDLFFRVDLPAVFTAFDTFTAHDRLNVDLLMREGHTACRAIIHVAGPSARLLKEIEGDP